MNWVELIIPLYYIVLDYKDYENDKMFKKCYFYMFVIHNLHHPIQIIMAQK